MTETTRETCKVGITKGGWVADNGDSEIWGVFSEIDADGIAYLCEPNGKPLRSFEEAEANAHLIAAAPDMYEALKNCIIDAGQPLTKGERLHRIKYAKAALAKAGGK